MPLTKVTSGVIAANAVVDSFGTQSITGDKIGLNAITGNTLASNIINSNNIVNSAVTGPKLGANAINANNIVNGTITTTQIASNTVSNTNIATGAVENYLRANNLDFGMRNRIINGAMVIDQRNAGANVMVTTSGQYTLDRWQGYNTQASKFSVQQNAGSVTPPAGFKNYLGVTSTSAYSITSGDVFSINQPVEGFNVADLAWGTANAKAVTLSFWVRSSLTGTFGGVVRSRGSSDAYPFTYTISSANTWEYKNITIPGPTSGSFPTDNTACFELGFGLGVGSTYTAAATGSWATGGTFYGANGATSVVGTNGATFYITGVQLEVGSSATSFEYRSYGTEMFLCQRYYEQQDIAATATDRPFSVGGAYVSGGSVISQQCLFFKVLKRGTPTVTFSAASTFSHHCPGAFRNNLTNISLNNALVTGLQIVATSGTGGGSPSAQGLCAILESSGAGGTASIGISAEL